MVAAAMAMAVEAAVEAELAMVAEETERAAVGAAWVLAAEVRARAAEAGGKLPRRTDYTWAGCRCHNVQYSYHNSAIESNTVGKDARRTETHSAHHWRPLSSRRAVGAV